MLKSYKKTTAFMSAALMTGVISKVAHAQGDFESYTDTLSDNVSSPFANTIAFICYMGGFVLAALGVVGLKQHVENPGNAPMKNALAKLGFGGMLMVLPPAVSAMQGTAVDTNTTTGLETFTVESL